MLQQTGTILTKEHVIGSVVVDITNLETHVSAITTTTTIITTTGFVLLVSITQMVLATRVDQLQQMHTTQLREHVIGLVTVVTINQMASVYQITITITTALVALDNTTQMVHVTHVV